MGRERPRLVSFRWARRAVARTSRSGIGGAKRDPVARLRVPYAKLMKLTADSAFSFAVSFFVIFLRQAGPMSSTGLDMTKRLQCAQISGEGVAKKQQALFLEV